MKTIYRRRFFVIIILLLCGTFWSSAKGDKEKEFISLTCNKAKVDLKLSKNHRTYKSLTNSLGWLWGTDGEDPKTQIEHLTVFYIGHEIKIPRWVFLDLFNPIQATFSLSEEREGLFVLSFEGGDAAGAYKVRLIIENGIFNKREIEDSVDLDKIWSESATQLMKGGKRTHPRKR